MGNHSKENGRWLSLQQEHSILLLSLFLLMPATTCADNTDIEGEEKTEQSQQYRQNVQRLEARIIALESEQGAYSPELVNAWEEIGDWYLASTQVLKAIEAYEKALHLSKVNLGMQNMSHAGIVEKLIEANTYFEDWQAIDNNLHYLLWLYRRNHSAEDDALISIIHRVGRWYMQAYTLHSGGEALSYLIKADDLFEEAIKTIESRDGENSSEAIRVLGAVSTINYYIADNVVDVFKMSHRDIREAMIPNKRATPYMNEVAVRDYYFDQSFYKGRRALRRIISIYESQLPESAIEYATALVYEGDFYLSLNRKWNAMRNYSRAHEVLHEHEADEHAFNAIFGEPRQVIPFSIPGYEIEEVENIPYVDAVFDVPQNGRARNIRVLNIHPPDKDKLGKRAKHKIAALRFRPRFENGEPVDTEGVSLRYRFSK